MSMRMIQGGLPRRSSELSWRPTLCSNLERGAKGGFTLVEMIIYIAIVSIIVVSTVSLILDLTQGQAEADVRQEVNQNIRTIIHQITTDIRQAHTINALSPDVVTLGQVGHVVTYAFADSQLTRQVDGGEVAVLHSDEVAVTGQFIDRSLGDRSKNIEVLVTVTFNNPDQLSTYEASGSADYTIELRGRK